MKRLNVLAGFVVLFVALSSGSVSAQGMPNIDFSKMDVGALQKAFVEFENCMQDVDVNDFKALQKQAESASNEIDDLCSAGKRDLAQSKAKALYKEVKGDKTLQMAIDCSDGLTDLMPNQGPQSPLNDKYENLGDSHICD